MKIPSLTIKNIRKGFKYTFIELALNKGLPVMGGVLIYFFATHKFYLTSIITMFATAFICCYDFKFGEENEVEIQKADNINN